VSSKFWSRRALRRHLIAGLIVIAPVTVTAFVLWWIFQLLDGLLGRFLYPVLSRLFPWFAPIPGLGLLVLVALLVVVGWAAELAIGSRIVGWWNRLLERIPVTRKIYGAANRIVRTVLGEGSRPFNKVVMVEYPSPGRWSIGFLAARAPALIQEHVRDSVSVFIPTTPNPTSGWIVVVPRHGIIELAMTVDQAFTYILSAGSVTPDALPHELAAPATRPSGERDPEVVLPGRPPAADG